MFTLHVEAEQWHEHSDKVCAASPGLVPVAKGNGYGFGLAMLATEAQRLGCDTLAVGQLDEVRAVHDTFLGDVLVLTPWNPVFDDEPIRDDRLILTAADHQAIRALGGSGSRTVVELLTSMRRFGLDEEALTQALPDIGNLNLNGFALHLPLDDGPFSRVDEVSSWLTTLRRLRLSTDTLWVSHLTDDDLERLSHRHPETTFRPRVGTRLWLGAPSSYRARGTVLAVHPTNRGQRFGYRQRRAPGEGTLLIVSGGTSHGVALVAPKSVRTISARAKAAAHGGLEASGRALSPFYVSGRRRWFAEPPHMQVSMLWLPHDATAPNVGDEVEADVRMTTVTFDRLVFH